MNLFWIFNEVDIEKVEKLMCNYVGFDFIVRNPNGNVLNMIGK